MECRGLKSLQINLHHCRDANDALTEYAIENSVDIILCQDIYFWGDRALVFLLNGLYIFPLTLTTSVYKLYLDNSVFASLNVKK